MEEKRIISTTVLAVFLAIVCLLCWLVVDLLVFVQNYSPDVSGELEGVEGEEMLVLGVLMGFIAIAPYFFILACSVLLILISLCCLGGSIVNTRIKFKPVRITNIVYSCCFAAATALGIIALILMRVL